MNNQYQQVVTTAESGHTITYVQFVNPQTQIVYCKEESHEEASCELESYIEEESYIEDEEIEEVEVLESIVVEPRKSSIRTELVKKLVQVKGELFSSYSNLDLIS